MMLPYERGNDRGELLRETTTQSGQSGPSRSLREVGEKSQWYYGCVGRGF